MAEDIRKASPNAQVKIIVADFALSAKEGFFDEFLSDVEGLDISVLVNNVGVEFVTPFHECKEQDVQRLIAVNTVPISVLSRRLIAKFLARRRRSAIINLASSVSQVPMAGYHVYGASKAYDDYLSRSLSYEYPQLDIMSVRPSEVSTAMTSNKPTDILTITAEQCVEGALNDLGWDRTTNGHWSHKAQSVLMGCLPERVFDFIFQKFIMPSFVNERKALGAAQKKTE